MSNYSSLWKNILKQKLQPISDRLRGRGDNSKTSLPENLPILRYLQHCYYAQSAN